MVLVVDMMVVVVVDMMVVFVVLVMVVTIQPGYTQQMQLIIPSYTHTIVRGGSGYVLSIVAVVQVGPYTHRTHDIHTLYT